MASRLMIGNKRHNRHPKFLAFVVIAMSIAALLTYASLSGKRSSLLDQTDTSVKSSTQETSKQIVDYASPTSLVIPKLGISAAITSAGLTPDGDMEVPSNIAETGWYKYGVHPGNIGSAVIAGHLIGKKGEPGIFIDLGKLRPGDTFQVVDNKSQTATFAVREIRTYGQHDQPTEVFEPNDKSYLNLITCSGEWNQSDRRYSDRLVVFADKTN